MTIPFGGVSLGLAAAPTGWAIESGPGSDPGLTNQIANGYGTNGDQTHAEAHSPVSNWDEVYTCINNTNTIPAAVGVMDGTTKATLVGIKVETSIGQARMTLSFVRYTADADVSPARKFTHGVSSPATAFGAQSFMGATAGDAVLQSSSVDIKCNVAAAQPAGTYLQHEVYGATITAEESWMDVPSTNAGSGWTVNSAAPNLANGKFLEWNVSGQKAAVASTTV